MSDLNYHDDRIARREAKDARMEDLEKQIKYLEHYAKIGKKVAEIVEDVLNLKFD